LFALVGAIELVWTQVNLPNDVETNGLNRWQYATPPLILMAVGSAVIAVALVLVALAQPPSRSN
jgi:hypothetical protein